MIEVYEVDINKSYYLDDDLNIWEDLDKFYEYHLEDYTGIKDNMGLWKNELIDEYKVQELMGDEVIEAVVTYLEEMMEYYKNKYHELI
jgi:DNA-binding ferritin-like protein (Dps family)